MSTIQLSAFADEAAQDLQGMIAALKANNLTDTLAFAHTSFIKNAAPLTGRNLTAGLRVSF